MLEMEVNGVKIEFLGHSGFAITSKGGRRLIIDPYNVSSGVEKGDFILLTHSHYDHCSIKDIEKLAREGSTIIMTADCQSKVARIEGAHMQVIEVGDKAELGTIKIEAVAAYNVDKDFHPKSEGWVGYVIKFGDTIIYHAGDTDFIPEMHKLSGHGRHGKKFVAIYPVSGKFVMDAEEAADAASMISADYNLPMHYGAGVVGTIEDAERFVELCKEKGLSAKILEKA